MKKKVDLIAHTDYGSNKTPKGSDVYYIAKELKNKKILNKIYCRGKNEKIKETKIITPIPFKNLIPKFFTFIERYIIKNFPSRYLSVCLLDFYVKKKTEPAFITLFWGPMNKTAEKIKKKSIRIAMGTNPHPLYSLKILKHENKNRNILDSYSNKVNLFYKNIDYVFARSEFVKKSFIENGFSNDKIRMIGNGIEIEKFYPDPKKKKNKFRVLFLTNISIRKGLQYILKAWSELNLKNSELIVVGYIHEEVKPIIKKYKSLKNVKYIGYANTLEFYQSSDIYVLPSLSEGSPKTALEAMACELPIIVFENTGTLARNNKDGFILKNRDVEGIKEKILFLYNNPKQRLEMGKNARQQAKKYSRKNYAKKIVNFIEEIIKHEIN